MDEEQAAQLQRIEDKMDLVLEQTAKKRKKNTARIAPLMSDYEVKEQITAEIDTETGEILEWPEWYSLGYELKGWSIDFTVAEKWRAAGDYSEEYCLAQIYKVRGWWTTKHEKEGRSPYNTFQSACRENWAKYQEPTVTTDPKYQRDYDRRWGKEG